MNWLDIIGILIIVFIVIGSIILDVIAIMDKEYWFVGRCFVGRCFVVSLFLCALVVLIFFFVCDKSAGVTQGYITSVDKNFFGTTAIFIKTSESSQEEYCIEDDKIVDIANENIGKKVTVKYGKRVGLYSTGRCNKGPIESIKLAENE